MNELSIHEKAVGPCVVCGANSEGSLYWVGMNEKQWAIVRPYIVHLFAPDMIQKTLFIAPLDKPLCGVKCSKEYHDGKTTR